VQLEGCSKTPPDPTLRPARVLEEAGAPVSSGHCSWLAFCPCRCNRLCSATHAVCDTEKHQFPGKITHLVAQQGAVHAGVVPGAGGLRQHHHGQHVARGDDVDDGVEGLAQDLPRRLQRPRRRVAPILALCDESQTE